MTASYNDDLEDEVPMEEEDEFDELLLEEEDERPLQEVDEESETSDEAEEEDEDEEDDVNDLRQTLEADEPQVGATEGFRTDRILSRFERARIKAARLVSIIHGAAIHPSVPEEIRRLGAEEVVDYELDHRLIPLCIERTVENKRGVVFQETLRLSDMDLVVPSQRLSWWMNVAEQPTRAAESESEPEPNVETEPNNEEMPPASTSLSRTNEVKKKTVAKKSESTVVPEGEASVKKAPAKKKAVKTPEPEIVPAEEQPAVDSPVVIKKKTPTKKAAKTPEPEIVPAEEQPAVEPTVVIKKKTPTKKAAKTPEPESVPAEEQPAVDPPVVIKKKTPAKKAVKTPEPEGEPAVEIPVKKKTPAKKAAATAQTSQ